MYGLGKCVFWWVRARNFRNKGMLPASFLNIKATWSYATLCSIYRINPLNAELETICRLLALLGKGKGLPQRPKVAQGFSCRLRPRIFLTFGTTRVVGRQHYIPATFTQEKSLVLIFRGWVDLRAHGSVGSYAKIPNDITGNRSRDRPTSSAVP